MSKENPISTLLKAVREGSLFVRRAQLIAKDMKKIMPEQKAESDKLPEIPGLYGIHRFASEVLGDGAVFKELAEPMATSRFDLLMGVAPTTCNKLFCLWKNMFACESKLGDNIDQEIEDGGETTNAFLFRMFRSVEPDEETMGISASDIRRKRLTAITLPEMMIAEMFHFKATRGGHLNLRNGTICAGTKFKDGSYPVVRFEQGHVVIDWVKPNDGETRLGTRLVVRR